MFQLNPARLAGRAIATATLAVLIVFAAFLAAPARADEFSAAQKAEIEQIVKSYLVKNPEILREAAAELDARERQAESLARQKIVGDPSSPLFDVSGQAVIGNPAGAVTLVEFFDYNCGYCKRALGDLGRLMKENPDLRVVLRDLPILSQGSVDAAKIANAASAQLKGPKFWEFHQKLLGSRAPVGKTEALAAAKEAGVDQARLEKDAASPEVTAAIDQSLDLAKGLNINGTPSYVIGNEVVVGAVGFTDLQGKIANVRKCGKAVCS